MLMPSGSTIRWLATVCLVGAAATGCATKQTRHWVAEPVVINENIDDDRIELDRKAPRGGEARSAETRDSEESADGEPARFAGMVAAHNRVRAQVEVPALSWSADLASRAQRWAEHLQSAKSCEMEHSHASGVGENLAWASGQQLTPSSVVKMWADEAQDYNPESGACTPGAVCGHYTQVVWKNTRKVGCGVASCGRDEIWVCNYSPPGNYIGERPF